MIRVMINAKVRIPSVEPISRLESVAVAIGVGVAIWVIVAAGSKAALKKNSATPSMAKKTIRD